MPEPDYQLVDFDNHYYEAEDAFTRHGDESVKSYVHWVAEGKKRRIMFGTQLHTAIPNPTFNPVGKPGAYHERLRELARRGERQNFGSQSSFGAELEPLPDHYRERESRLHVMDEQGIERAIFYPTLAVGVDGLNPTHVEMTYKLFHAFNLWLEEDWGFNYQGRILAAPFIPMIDPARSVAELDAVLGRGAQIIAMRPGPAGGRSPADTAWDPFWARVNEAGIVASYHASAGPDAYSRMFNDMWQQHGVNDATYENNLQGAITGGRGMLETAIALVLGNLFGRFPDVRIASVELGGEWVEYCLHLLDHAGGIVGRQIEAFGARVEERPSDIFKRHIWVSPFPEEDVARLVDTIGADRVLFGSDWPHLEGTPSPVDYVSHLHKLDAFSVKRIMRDNALELLPA